MCQGIRKQEPINTLFHLRGDRESAVTAFQKLTISGLSEVNPQLLVKWFRYTHPPMLDRIDRVAEKEGQKRRLLLKRSRKRTTKAINRQGFLDVKVGYPSRRIENLFVLMIGESLCVILSSLHFHRF